MTASIVILGCAVTVSLVWMSNEHVSSTLDEFRSEITSATQRAQQSADKLQRVADDIRALQANGGPVAHGVEPLVSVGAVELNAIAELESKMSVVLSDIQGILRTILENQSELQPLLLPDGYRRPKDSSAVDSLVGRLSQSAREVRNELFCKVPGQVYRLYGVPDDVVEQGDQMHWKYFGKHPSDGHQVIVDVAFRSGIAINASLISIGGGH
jgi:hypothetical protein